ncbi:MAG: cytochrome c [Candidatus Didemnitutus sp.]|nr:cytochrome c [Candidatus Didemnitutus sp.]
MSALTAGLSRRWRIRLAFALGGAALLAARGRAADAWTERGREVYIREGCIHCHSQYVRPHAPLDIERWGPATPLAQLLQQRPPLPGNRRQGPDLANVGNRRTAEWNRLHLQAPRTISPGSRMPSYAHLFAGEDSDGEALVAYLSSLGADTIPERLAQRAAWRLPSSTTALERPKAAALFAELCAHCHGDTGRGDGPLAARLSVRPPDWGAGAWRHLAPGADVELELARIIKFGLPGSPMAGHEYLRDGEILGLARVVRSWQETRR